jgi:hypothetical protein
VTILSDLANELEDYVANEVTMAITNLTLVTGTPGSVNVNEVWKFKVNISNSGELNMTNVELHVHGANGALVGATSTGPWEPTVIPATLAVGVGDSEETDFVYFKAPSSQKPAGTVLVTAHVVERCGLPVAGGAIEADRLGEGLVRLQVEGPGAVAPSLEFQGAEEPAPQTQATDRVGDPHALDLRGLLAVELEGGTADRLVVQGGDQEQTGRRSQFVVGRRKAACGVEAGVESAGQFHEVGRQAVPGLRVAWVLGADLDHRSN